MRVTRLLSQNSMLLLWCMRAVHEQLTKPLAAERDDACKSNVLHAIIAR